jgi:hypothetical protein
MSEDKAVPAPASAPAISKTPVVDLASLDTVAACDKGAEVELRHPTKGTGLGMFISVLGRDSSVFKNTSRNTVDQRLRRDALQARRGREAEVRTTAEIEQTNMELLVACTTGWRNIRHNGELLAFNAANVEMIYRAYPWIYDQINDAIGSLENFLPA